MKNHFVRRAVTLMEVIFAIGVILIGLLGLLSILPLAGRRAQESIDLSVGPNVGNQVMDILLSEKFLANGRLWRIPPDRDNMTRVGDVTATSGLSFCIDPMFASLTTPPPNVIDNGYTPTLFPYYKATHNPLVDPSTGASSTPIAQNWPFTQPRMFRVGITRDPAPNPNFDLNFDTLRNTASPILLTSNEALNLAESGDDINVFRSTDRTLPATLNGYSVVDSGLEYGVRFPRGDYSWFAVVNPLPGGQYASVSVVVLKKRVRNFATPEVTDAPSSPSENGVGERIAYVTFATGFRGGAGGDVHLASNSNTVSDLSANDWVMLSSFKRTSGTAGGPVDPTTGNFFHRWYRVVAVNGEPEEFLLDGSSTVNDSNLIARIPDGTTNGTRKAWRRKVTLDGPDWAFGFNGSGDNSFEGNTFATIVEGVVSVTERTVLLNDL